MSPSHPWALSPPLPLSHSHQRHRLLSKFNSNFGFGLHFTDYQDEEVDGRVGRALMHSPALCLSVPICREIKASA